MRPVLRSVTAAALAGLLTLSLASCGEDKKSSSGDEPQATETTDAAADEFAAQPAQDILDAAMADTRKATSLRMKGNVPSDNGMVDLDISLNDQKQCEGSVGTKGGSADFIYTDNTVYLQADEAFWKAQAGEEQGATMAQMFEGKWAKTTQSTETYASFCDLTALTGGLKEGSATASTVGDRGEVDGSDAIELTEEKPGSKSSLWVATGSPHYILKLENAENGQAGVLTFTDYNEPVDITVPDSSDVIDLDTM